MPQSLKEVQESGQKVLILFVKPWHDPQRCKKWVNACSRKNFMTECIAKNLHICALHLPKEKGTTEEFPDPLKATLTTVEMEKTCHKRKAPTRREFESTSNGKKAKTLSHQGKIQSSFPDLGKYFLRPEQYHDTKLFPLPSFVNSWIFGTPGNGLPLKLLLKVESLDKAILNVAPSLRVILHVW